MKKLLAIMLLAGGTAFTACSTETGNNVGVDTEAQQNSSSGNGGSSSPVMPAQNDTTGAAATEETQMKVGNSQTRGETNDTRSRTTQNQLIHADSVKQ